MGYRENPGWLRTAIGQGVDTFQQFRQLRDERLRREEDVKWREEQAKKAELQALYDTGNLTFLGKKQLASMYGVDALSENKAEREKRLTAFANTKKGELDIGGLIGGMTPGGGLAGAGKFKIAGGWENMSDVDRKAIGLPSGDEKKFDTLKLTEAESKGKIDAETLRLLPIERMNKLQEHGANFGANIADKVLAAAVGGKGSLHKASNEGIQSALAPVFAEQLKTPFAANLSEEERNAVVSGIQAAVLKRREELKKDASVIANNYEVSGRAGHTEAEIIGKSVRDKLRQVGALIANVNSAETPMQATMRTLNDDKQSPGDRAYGAQRRALDNISAEIDRGNIEYAKQLFIDYSMMFADGKGTGAATPSAPQKLGEVKSSVFDRHPGLERPKR